MISIVTRKSIEIRRWLACWCRLYDKRWQLGGPAAWGMESWQLVDSGNSILRWTRVLPTVLYRSCRRVRKGEERREWRCAVHGVAAAGVFIHANWLATVSFRASGDAPSGVWYRRCDSGSSFKAVHLCLDHALTKRMGWIQYVPNTTPLPSEVFAFLR